jgi:hypothetical protein
VTHGAERVSDPQKGEKAMKHQMKSAIGMISGLLAIFFAFGASGLLAQQTQECKDCTELGKKAAALQAQADEAQAFLNNLASAQATIATLQAEMATAQGFVDAAKAHAAAYQELADRFDALFKRTKAAADQAQANAYRNDANNALKEAAQQSQRVQDLERQINDLQNKIQSAKANAQKLAQEAQAAWKAYYDCLKKAKCANTETGKSTPPVPAPNKESVKATQPRSLATSASLKSLHQQ